MLRASSCSVLSKRLTVCCSRLTFLCSKSWRKLFGRHFSVSCPQRRRFCTRTGTATPVLALPHAGRAFKRSRLGANLECQNHQRHRPQGHSEQSARQRQCMHVDTAHSIHAATRLDTHMLLCCSRSMYSRILIHTDYRAPTMQSFVISATHLPAQTATRKREGRVMVRGGGQGRPVCRACVCTLFWVCVYIIKNSWS
jgi:hypothetical protein